VKGCLTDQEKGSCVVWAFLRGQVHGIDGTRSFRAGNGGKGGSHGDRSGREG
jgi:hypothetical protein